MIPIPENVHPFRNRPGVLSLDSYIHSIWLDGVEQTTDQVLRVDPNRLLYTAVSVDTKHQDKFVKPLMGARTTRTALVNSAVRFQACRVTCAVGRPPLLTVQEEIVFDPCPPVQGALNA